MSSNLKVNTILPSVGSNIGLGTNGGNLNVDGGCKVQVGTALTLGHTVGVQFATQNLHSAGFEVNQINASGIITASHFYGNGANLTGLPASVTINNASANRVLTSDGGTTLNGEANLTFSGSTLKVNSTTGHSYLKLSSNDSYSGSIHFGDQSDDNAAQIWYDNYQGNGMYLRTSENTPMSFYTNGTPRLRIASNGNVSIGNNPTVASDTLLHVEKSGETNVQFEGDTSTLGARLTLKNNNTGAGAKNQIDFSDAGGQSTSSIIGYNTDQTNNYGELAFHTRSAQGSPPAERLRITSGGRILGGNHLNDRGAVLQIESSDHAMIGIHRNTADHGAPAMNFSASRGTSAGSNTIVQSGDYLGLIRFSGTDGSDLATGAMITGIVDGTPGSNDMPTRLGFWTSADGSQSPTERLRIDSNGYVTKTNTPFVMVTINSRTDWATTGSFLTIPWDTIHGRSTNSNVGSHFNTSNHRFTAPVDGRYLFVLSMNIVGDNIMRHNINGAAVSKGEYRMTQLVWDHIDASFIYDMNANDYYTTTSRLYDGSGKRWNGGNNASEGWDTLSIYLLG